MVSLIVVVIVVDIIIFAAILHSDVQRNEKQKDVSEKSELDSVLIADYQRLRSSIQMYHQILLKQWSILNVSGNQESSEFEYERILHAKLLAAIIADYEDTFGLGEPNE